MRKRHFCLVVATIAVSVCAVACNGQDFNAFKELALSTLTPTDKTFVEAALAKKIKGLSQKTWKIGDVGVVNDAMKVVEVIDEKTAIFKIGGGMYGSRGLPTDGLRVGAEVRTKTYVILAPPEEFETATGKKKYRAIIALTEEGRLTWLALSELSKYPIFERHDFEIDGAKVAGIFVGMQAGKVAVLSADGKGEPMLTPIENFTDADQAWVRQKIKDYSKKK